MMAVGSGFQGRDSRLLQAVSEVEIEDFPMASGRVRQ